MERRRAMLAMSSAVAAVFSIPSVAIEPDGYTPDSYRYSDTARGLDYVLFPATFRRVGADVRQGDFRLDITEQGSGLGTAIQMTGTVEVNCRLRAARLVANRIVDARGAPADALVGGAKAPTPWRGLADQGEDAHLLLSLCGGAGFTNEHKPATQPSRLPTFDDYPARALREGREGDTGFRVAFDASGAVVGCEIVASSGHADLDEQTCKLLWRRARFDPAPPGTGLRYHENRVRWRIP